MSTADPSPCPTEDDLLAWVAGELDEASAAVIARHSADCHDCAAVLAEAGRALAGSQSVPPVIPVHPDNTAAPARVGRYLLLDVLGRGAMGVVYAAYDPELDRRVAVKLVRVRGGVGRADRDELQQRLLREAQAMARLSHPHVVAVHDIGVLDGSVWLAMDLVAGRTLRDWLETPRSWRAVLEVFLQAGEGLAAAHAAGIVHRDFKPENVLIGADGRARVTDFGLARVPQREVPEPRGSADIRQTLTGTIMGTPAYMAPEQLLGGSVDARADVFAFGVSLYEALFGCRPYPGGTLDELEASIRKGVPREPPRSAAPRWVRRAVLRAVAAAPEARFPSMRALLDALRADPLRRLLRVAAPIGAFTLATLVLGGTWALTTADARACRAGATRAELTWTPTRAERVRAAFVSAGPAYGEASFRRVEDDLRARISAWGLARRATCDASFEAGAQQAQLLELRLRCLDDRLAEQEALALLFETADEALVRGAAEAVVGLPDLAVCDDVHALLTRAPPPSDPTARALAERARRLRADATAAELAERGLDGLPIAEEARTLAQDAGDRAGAAEALGLVGRLASLAGQNERAEEALRAAFLEGVAAGDDRVAARAAIQLVAELSFLRRPPAEFGRWAELAEAHITRLGGDPSLTVRLLLARGSAALSALEPARALVDLERAAALQQQVEGLDDVAIIRTLGVLAFAQEMNEDYPKALATYEQALSTARGRLGPLHPGVQRILRSYGGCLARAGKAEGALPILSEALDGAIRVYPANHLNIPIAMLKRGLALGALGRLDEAIADSREAVRREREILGDDLGSLASALLILGMHEVHAGEAEAALARFAEARDVTLRHLDANEGMLSNIEALEAEAFEELGRYAEAEAGYRSAERRARAFVGEGTDLALALDGRGRLLTRAGRPHEAVKLHRETVRMIEEKQRVETIELAPSLQGLGDALLAAGAYAEARDVLGRAVALHERLGGDPIPLAWARASLARASWSENPAFAEPLLASARAALEASPYPRARRRLREIDGWAASLP